MENVEVKIDAINNDIASFRLDMIDVYDNMEQMNMSMCSRKSPTSQTMPTEVTVKQSSQTQEVEKRLLSAWQREKKYTRNQYQELVNRIEILEKGQKDLETLSSGQSESIENVLGDLKFLKETVVSNTVNRDEFINIKNQTINVQKKITTMADAQQHLVHNVKGFGEKIQQATQDIKNMVEKVNKIDEIEKKVQTIDTVMNKLKLTFIEIDKLSDEVSCLYPWNNYRESCYYFSNLKLSWKNAMTDCQSKGGSLVEYKNKAEVQDIAKMALSISSENVYWVGATDIEKEGNWKWSKSGSTVNFRYWMDGNPDNYYNEDCMTTQVEDKGIWNDAACHSEKKYICQKAKYVSEMKSHA
ncbi:CD209 antigen-like [Ruditapes philippinarum]|uniref:CD209 antigen-like n=1 Tax=Ruditapes philippinarum TaxID=129788 RepID=UPI00295BBDF1|nr:CD209 antigen-like [Ruditapes philippinarum]